MKQTAPGPGTSARRSSPASTALRSPPGPLAHSGRTQRTPVRGIALIAIGAFAVEMAVSGRYGYHRDELYFLAAGQHLAFGYVDQPPLTPVLARIFAAASGNTLIGLRVLPALALAALVILTAAMSRLLGAGRTGQLLAALATATCAQYLGVMHLLTTTTPDFIAWAVTLLLVLRLLASQDPRWWLATGCSIGVGLEAKWNIGFLAAGIAVGFLATNARSLLRNRYLLIACGTAIVIAAPDVAWQALHGWPNLQVFHSLQGSAWHNRATYWPAQVLYTGLALTPLWIIGLAWSLRSKAGRRFRPAGIATTFAITIYFVLGGKPYYPGAAFTFFFAAGAVPLEHWLASLAGRRGRAGRALQAGPVRPRVRRGLITPAALAGAAMLASAGIAIPVALPVLPARTLHAVPLQKINYDLAETIAWPGLVALVAREYGSLPGPQRRVTTIIAGNYGEAGAIERYRGAFGMPEVYSGANNFWLWGPPPAAATGAVAVNVDLALLRREFARVRQVATFSNGSGVSDDEQGAQIFIATGLKSSWATAWPAFRDYS